MYFSSSLCISQLPLQSCVSLIQLLLAIDFSTLAFLTRRFALHLLPLLVTLVPPRLFHAFLAVLIVKSTALCPHLFLMGTSPTECCPLPRHLACVFHATQTECWSDTSGFLTLSTRSFPLKTKAPLLATINSNGLGKNPFHPESDLPTSFSFICDCHSSDQTDRAHVNSFYRSPRVYVKQHKLVVTSSIPSQAIGC